MTVFTALAFFAVLVLTILSLIAIGSGLYLSFHLDKSGPRIFWSGVGLLFGALLTAWLGGI